MRGRRVLLSILVIVAALVVIAYLLLTQVFSPSTEIESPEMVETAVPPAYIDILVSAQNPIPRGWQFEDDDGAMSIQQWPVDSIPPAGYFSSEVQVAGFYAAQNIPMGTPILASMLSEAVIAPFPEGRVAYGLPMDLQGGLGWHIQEGDHVDVLAALELVNVDPEFQSRLPNLYQALPDPADENAAAMALSGPMVDLRLCPMVWLALFCQTGNLLRSWSCS